MQKLAAAGVGEVDGDGRILRKGGTSVGSKPIDERGDRGSLVELDLQRSNPRELSVGCEEHRLDFHEEPGLKPLRFLDRFPG